MAITRSDRLRIKPDSPAQRDALTETLDLYRRLVRDLCIFRPIMNTYSGRT